MFKSQFLLQDLVAGFSVAVFAIPLSLAVAMAANVAPSIALSSAIIGGIIAAIFGGTRYTITGPAIAMSILIAECIQNSGMIGLFIIGLTCGILQIALGVFRIGHIIKLIPAPVISAFIAAIGFFICVEQLALLQHLSIYSNFFPVTWNLNYTFFS
jgi:MFS superfamily sulfate permease-like transporter